MYGLQFYHFIDHDGWNYNFTQKKQKRKIIVFAAPKLSTFLWWRSQNQKQKKLSFVGGVGLRVRGCLLPSSWVSTCPWWSRGGGSSTASCPGQTPSPSISRSIKGIFIICFSRPTYYNLISGPCDRQAWSEESNCSSCQENCYEEIVQSSAIHIEYFLFELFILLGL